MGKEQGDYSIKDSTTALDRIRLISTFFYTIPGPKMIWQFGEMGYDYSINYNGRLGEKPVRWDYYDDWRRKYNYDFISALINLRINNDVFETDDYTLDVYGVMKKIKLYSDQMNVVIVGNFGMTSGEISPGFDQTGTWYEYFTGETLEVTDVNMDISLNQGEYRIYTDLELETPDIGTGIITPDVVPLHTFSGSIFPNPVTGKARLQLDLDKETKLGVSIYNLLGSEVSLVEEKIYKSGKQIIDLETQLLKPGIYFCVIRSGQKHETIKIIKQ